MQNFFKIFIICFFSLVSLVSVAQEVNPNDVFGLAKGLKLSAMDPLEEKNESLYSLGEALFFEKELSGNRNISCGSCHSPRFYSGDGLALGVGQGAVFGKTIDLKEGAILKRHTPHLINLGRIEVNHYFWDGRVAQSVNTGNLSTPELGLNGSNPVLKEIRASLSGPLAAQALFPLLSPEEMLGRKGDNELSQWDENSKVWDAIVKRLYSSELNSDYKSLFKKSFPGLSIDKINVGHIGSALAEFQRFFFSSTDSPFDQFMRGDLNALDPKAVRGLNIFMTKGRCVTCHKGAQLSIFQFHSSGAPQLGLQDNFNDEGRKEVTNKGRARFKFKTPSLRNIALTGPYMHSGSLQTLDDVVNHYNDINTSLNSYIPGLEIQDFYKNLVSFDNDSKRNELRYLQVEGTAFLLGLKLTDQEKEDLVHFLEVGLTDLTFKKRMDDYVKKL